MIYLATDHRGFELKEKIKQWLTEWNYEFQDMGAFEHEKDDDYPDFIHKAAEKVSVDPENSKSPLFLPNATAPDTARLD